MKDTETAEAFGWTVNTIPEETRAQSRKNRRGW